MPLTRVFIGFDPRQPLAYNVLQSSIHRHAQGRVQVEPLELRKLPTTRRGLTEFTFSRFLVPWLCGYEGVAIFMDADIVVKGDVAELAAQANPEFSVQVMQEQPPFEWASVMLFNNERCKVLTPEFVNSTDTPLLDLAWGKVGTFSAEWTHCVGYQEPKAANLYHYTQGLPCWYESSGLPEDEAWIEERKAMTHTVSWKELMGRSVHAKPVLQRLFQRLTQ